MYPNPAADRFTVRYLFNPLVPSTIELYDTTGKLIEKGRIELNVQDVGTELSQGLFYYRIKSDDGTIDQSGSLIKLR